MSPCNRLCNRAGKRVVYARAGRNAHRRKTQIHSLLYVGKSGRKRNAGLDKGGIKVKRIEMKYKRTVKIKFLQPLFLEFVIFDKLRIEFRGEANGF